MGGEIHIGEDCWLGGNVIVLPGVTIGRGCTIGAGSVVTKVGGVFNPLEMYQVRTRFESEANGLSFGEQDVPPYKVVAGNPARVIRDVPRGTNAEVTSGALAALEADLARQSGP